MFRTLVAWNLGSADLACLSRELAQPIRRVSSEEQVHHILEHGVSCGLFVGPTLFVRPSDVEPVLKRLRGHHPQLVIIWVEQFSEHSYETPMRLLVSGAVDALTDSRRIEVKHIYEAFASRDAESVLARVSEHLGQMPSNMELVLRRALRLAGQPIAAAQLATHNAVAERTFRKQCQRWGIPNPQRLAAWARLLMAAWWLDRGLLNLSQIAIRLSFPSPDALRKLGIRTLGISLLSYEPGNVLASVASALRRDLEIRNPEIQLVGALDTTLNRVGATNGPAKREPTK